MIGGTTFKLLIKTFKNTFLGNGEREIITCKY